MMSIRMIGNWTAATQTLAILSDKSRWNSARDRAASKECHRLRKIMVESFNKGGPPGKRWKRLSVFTQLVSRALGKGDRRPLLDTGDMRNSHSVVKEGDTWFVGIHRTAKRKKDGKELVNIAAVHEYGSKPIYISTVWGRDIKIRAFFYWLSKKTKGQIKPLKRSTVGIIIRIPPRPWFTPIWEAESDRAAQNILTDTIKGMNLPIPIL